jgi:hypothetical protein
MVESPPIALAHKHDHELISRSRAATVPGGRESSLSRRDISFGTVELITHRGEVLPQQWRARPCISRGVSDMGAAGCSDNHQAFSRPHPRGRHHGFPRNPCSAARSRYDGSRVPQGYLVPPVMSARRAPTTRCLAGLRA